MLHRYKLNNIDGTLQPTTDWPVKCSTQLIGLHTLPTSAAVTVSKSQIQTGDNVLFTMTPGIKNILSSCELHIRNMFRANGGVALNQCAFISGQCKIKDSRCKEKWTFCKILLVVRPQVWTAQSDHCQWIHRKKLLALVGQQVNFT